jgi:hypothetical protein
VRSSQASQCALVWYFKLVPPDGQDHLNAVTSAPRVGHPNFKDEYAPNFLRVEIIHLASGRIASKDELEG